MQFHKKCSYRVQTVIHLQLHISTGLNSRAFTVLILHFYSYRLRLRFLRGSFVKRAKHNIVYCFGSYRVVALSLGSSSFALSPKQKVFSLFCH